MLQFVRDFKIRILWLIHNTIFHPIVGILDCFGFYRLSTLIHDKTSPKFVTVKMARFWSKSGMIHDHYVREFTVLKNNI